MTLLKGQIHRSKKAVALLKGQILPDRKARVVAFAQAPMLNFISKHVEVAIRVF